MPPKDWMARPCAILNFARCRRLARNRDAATRSASSCGRIIGGSTSSTFITGGFIGTALVPFSLAAFLWVGFLRPTPARLGSHHRRLLDAMNLSAEGRGRSTGGRRRRGQGRRGEVCENGGKKSKIWRSAESAWLPPCVVLVINDNLYGLMFVLSYL